MSHRHISIRALLLALVIAVVLPVVTVGGYAVYGSARQDIERAKSDVRTLAKVIAANTSHTLAANREALEVLSRRPLMRLVDGERCDPILAEFRSIFPRFANLTTIDMAGIAWCSAVPQPGGKPVNVFRTEWFQRALEQQRFLAGDPFVGPITGKWVSVLISPIRGEDNGVKGFMGLPLDLSAYDPHVAAAPMMPGTRYGILSASGRLIWRNADPDQLIGKDVQDREAVKKTLATKDGGFESAGTDGVPRFYAVAPIPEADWYAFVGVPSQPIFAAAMTNAVINAAIGLVFVLGIAALAIHLARRIARPTLALAATARQLKAGAGDVRAAIEGPDEVAEVAAEFNEMVDSLQAAERELRQLNASLEQRVAQRTAELENANKELEAFSYSVSHDLRAPLRAIDGFAKLLKDDERDRLSEDGKGLLDRVTANVQKLAKLIDDILGYSRAGRLPLHRAAVDVEALLAPLVEELRSAYPDVEIRFGNLPPADGDAAMLRQVFQNLVGNACKFSAGRPNACVEIGADEQAGETVWFVKDNGVGFDMQYVDKLFRIFQRLHRESEFPGSGVGLSIVKQLIDRHGGRVWCEAEPGRGARFYFTLGPA